MAGSGGDLLVALEVVPMYSTSSASPPPSADAAVVVDGCDGYAVVPTAYSTWFRANTISSDAKTSTLTYDSFGLGATTIHSTEASDNVVP